MCVCVFLLVIVGVLQPAHSLWLWLQWFDTAACYYFPYYFNYCVLHLLYICCYSISSLLCLEFFVFFVLFFKHKNFFFFVYWVCAKVCKYFHLCTIQAVYYSFCAVFSLLRASESKWMNGVCECERKCELVFVNSFFFCHRSLN